MDEILLNTNIKLTFYELLSYFSTELICILGVILNLIISFFIMKKLKLKRLSDVITCSVFCLNSIILTFFMFQGESFSIQSDYLIFNGNTVFLKLFINLFALFFVISTYKYTRKSKFRVPVVNSILILIIFFSGLLLSSDNFALTYVLLECIIILIYKYASNMRVLKNSIYSPTYITISFLATCFFVTFYLMDYFVQDPLQKSIMQSCMVLSLLLKIGLFPIYNYSIDKKCKSNIPYSILLFCILPFVGAFAINKIISLCMFNEVCQLSTSAFVLVFALLASISAYKTKNLTGYFASSGQIYICLYILNSVLTKDLNPKFIIIVLSCLLALYSLVRIYKNNKKFTHIFSVLLMLYSLIIILFGKEILYSIYTFDKMGFFAINVFIFCNILIIIKTLKMIESFYKK